jgi:hypothetical protein
MAAEEASVTTDWRSLPKAPNRTALRRFAILRGGVVATGVEFFNGLTAFIETRGESRVIVGERPEEIAKRLGGRLIKVYDEESGHFELDSRNETNAVLTARELYLLKLVHAGKTNQEIADELELAKGTIAWSLNTLSVKMGYPEYCRVKLALWYERNEARLGEAFGPDKEVVTA